MTTTEKPRVRVPAVMARDSLVNFAAQMGTSKDKATHTQYGLHVLTPNQLENAYRGDWIARKAVDIPAFDSTREGRLWQAEDSQIELLEAEEKRVAYWPKLTKALIRARLYGGAALVIGVDDGQEHDQPLNLTRIRPNGLRYIHVASFNDISAGPIIRDITSDWYGEPEYWLVTTSQGAQVRIHPSRVVPLIGNDLPDPVRSGQVWGDSVLQSIDAAIKQASASPAIVQQMLYEAKIDIVKMPHLAQSMATAEDRALLVERFMTANMIKSLNNSLLLDSEEDWQSKQLNFSMLPEIIRVYLMIASAAADIPATRFLGQSPNGFSATGESDTRNYYDRIASEQENKLTPALSRLDEVLIWSALGERPAEIHYTWKPLWQLGDDQKATIAKTKAEAIAVYADRGLVPQDALAAATQNMLVEDGLLPGLEAALVEFPDDIDENDPEVRGQFGEQPEPVEAADAKPRTLYVSRAVLNADEIAAHFEAQGLEVTETDLHVTVAYSRQPVDWIDVGESWAGSDKDGNLEITPGGARVMEAFGEGATVMAFASSDLKWRHQMIVEKGASWDWPDYQPHVTLAYDFTGSLDDIEPWQGRILLGPERFAEIER